MSAPGQRQSPFPIVMRGYDRDQVTDHIRRLDAELQMMAADRDSAHASADELRERLEDSRSEIQSLQREVDTLSVPPTTVAGMSDRVSRMLQLATDEASELRANARDEAAETLSVARQDAERIRNDAATDATATKELAQDHADALITDAEKRGAEIEQKAEQTLLDAQEELARAREEAAAIIEAARDDAARLRGAAHNIAMNRLARSRELAGAAHSAHGQVLDHLEALRQHLGDLPDALALSGDEEALVAETDADDLALLNRTLVGRDRFSDDEDVAGRPSARDVQFDDSTPSEATDVLDAIADEYTEEEYDRFGGGKRDDGDGRTSATA